MLEDALVGPAKLPRSREKTPHRLMNTGRSKAWPYSSARASLASFVAPYRDTGGLVENDSDTPRWLTPCGSPLSSGWNPWSTNRIGWAGWGALL